jgi:hypothetical protein
MELFSPTLSGVTPSSVPTPATGKTTLFRDSVTGHLCQKDDTGKVIDLGAVGSDQASVGFDPTVLWSFDSSADGWTVINGTAVFDTANGKGLLVTDTSSVGGTTITSPSGLTIDGNGYRKVKASVTLVTLPAPLGSSVIPRLLYTTAGHGMSETFRKIVPWPVPLISQGNTVILDFDMETAENAPDWYAAPNNTITQIRLNLTDVTPTGTVLRINWVAVGRDTPVLVAPAAYNYKQIFSQVALQT